MRMNLTTFDYLLTIRRVLEKEHVVFCRRSSNGRSVGESKSTRSCNRGITARSSEQEVAASLLRATVMSTGMYRLRRPSSPFPLPSSLPSSSYASLPRRSQSVVSDEHSFVCTNIYKKLSYR